MPSQMELGVSGIVQNLLKGTGETQQKSNVLVHLQPDKKAIIAMIEQLQMVLFPDYFVKKKISGMRQNITSALFWMKSTSVWWIR